MERQARSGLRPFRDAACCPAASSLASCQWREEEQAGRRRVEGIPQTEMNRRPIAALALCAALLTTPALAKMPTKMGPHGMSMGQAKMSMSANPASAEFMASMQRMQGGMMKAMKSQEANPARLYAMMMIPHHQGAIDNSRIVLKHSRDAQIRSFAQKVIKAQTQEIATLHAFLKTHPDRAPAR